MSRKPLVPSPFADVRASTRDDDVLPWKNDQVLAKPPVMPDIAKRTALNLAQSPFALIRPLYLSSREHCPHLHGDATSEITEERMPDVVRVRIPGETILGPERSVMGEVCNGVKEAQDRVAMKRDRTLR